jgi:3-hydroxybutyryl-CoA dehydrogenase
MLLTYLCPYLHNPFTMLKIGIIGAGAMGSGIAQVAAQAGHEVIVFDSFDGATERSATLLQNTFSKLEEKGKINDAKSIFARLSFVKNIEQLADCKLIIEAIVEDIEVKKQVFAQVEKVVAEDCILATNTSSLSITSIAAACKNPSRVIGIHFFNPAPLMALVEIIPALQTDNQVVAFSKQLIDSWKKITVLCKDTPAFIVNRIARPFYSEALRILDEGIADIATIDFAMKNKGGFRMGPFELMDFIGHDVNFRVTESVFNAFYFDPRYKPSFSQKRLFEAGWLGKKTGRGFYQYGENAPILEANKAEELQNLIFNRIMVMLFNEAADALYWNIASAEDIDTAMLKGVNYPKGLLAWAQEYGVQNIVNQIDTLYDTYHEDRYRCSPQWSKM